MLCKAKVGMNFWRCFSKIQTFASDEMDEKWGNADRKRGGRGGSIVTKKKEREDCELKKAFGATKPRMNGNTVSKMTTGYREERKIPREYEEGREKSTSWKRREE